MKIWIAISKKTIVLIYRNTRSKSAAREMMIALHTTDGWLFIKLLQSFCKADQVAELVIAEFLGRFESFRNYHRINRVGIKENMVLPIYLNDLCNNYLHEKSE